MKRRLLHFLTALSLALSIGLCIVWIRVYRTADQFYGAAIHAYVAAIHERGRWSIACYSGFPARIRLVHESRRAQFPGFDHPGSFIWSQPNIESDGITDRVAVSGDGKVQSIVSTLGVDDRTPDADYPIKLTLRRRDVRL